MAGRSQLPVQIMENQTRYDLNAAVENWRNELAAQPNLASDDRRELETHLRDAIAGFQQRGLNDEESFWLARRRIGQPQQLVPEFVKANTTKVQWQTKLLIALVITVVPIWFLGKAEFHQVFVNFGNIAYFNFSLSILMIAIVWLVFILAEVLKKMRTSPRFSVLSPFIQTRWRVLISAVVLTVFSYTQIFLLLCMKFVQWGIMVSILGLFALVVWLLLPLRIQTKLKEIVSSRFPKRA
jgi:hypothetical protein